MNEVDVKCSKCQVPLQFSNSEPDIIFCPKCHAKGSRKDVMSQAQKQVSEQFKKSLKDALKGNKFIKIK